MNYSTTYIAIIVNILIQILPKLGVDVGSEQLTATIQTLVALGTGFWVLFKRHQAGGVSVIGVRK